MVFEKLKNRLHSEASPSIDLAAAAYPPSRSEVFKGRLQYGTNIGGWFCLEKWIVPAMFSAVKGGDDSEYAAVSASVRELGVDKTRAKWEQHWDSFVSESEFEWMAKHHVNAVRVPMGYWTLGERFVSGTPFAANCIPEVYKNSWAKYMKMIAIADKYGIGVLVDLHGVPGGANGESHSGIKDGGKFFSTSKDVSTAVNIVAFIAEQVKQSANVIGIQLVNEAAWNSKAEKYYNSAIKRVREIDPTQYVYISDAWDRSKFVDFVKHMPGVIVDTHVYKCFSDSDNAKSADQLIRDVREHEELNTHCVVGEYSCTLSGSSWDKSGNNNRDRLRKEYGSAQCQLYNEFSAGSFFWTFKFAEGRAGEWDLREMIDQECISFPKRTGRKPPNTDGTPEAKNAVQSHAQYWDKETHGKKMEHWRYEMGFAIGWRDAAQFWAIDESRIGARETWKSMRTADHIRNKGGGEFIWEFEQGYTSGFQALAETLK
ncbi:glycoside hydrolase superfamily [Kockiozyma suomiensis]|uniref:glycoside hydrolase superfamily n=1 Tax=Kockiozyma suomiensis TaxID=1337062 RepID=UPI003343C1BE